MEMEDTLNAYLKNIAVVLKRSPVQQLDQMARLLLETRRGGNWIFTAGNGGSAATSSHFANDFVKGLSAEGKKRFKVLPLHDCVPILTALSNDISYEETFEYLLKSFGSPQDIFIAFSGSGNSQNIVNAAKYAKTIGMKVGAFTGRDGGKIGAFADVNVIAPTDVMEEIEDVHMVWEHNLVIALREIISKEQI
jgi:D-sedoheptulose 7-phosphate isomerase